MINPCVTCLRDWTFALQGLGEEAKRPLWTVCMVFFREVSLPSAVALTTEMPWRVLASSHNT